MTNFLKEARVRQAIGQTAGLVLINISRATLAKPLGEDITGLKLELGHKELSLALTQRHLLSGGIVSRNNAFIVKDY